jgi:hypothetical protein
MATVRLNESVPTVPNGTRKLHKYPVAHAQAQGPKDTANATVSEFWAFSSGPFLQANPRRLALQARILDWTYINIIVKEPEGGRRTEPLEAALLDECRKPAPERGGIAFTDAVCEVLALCRETYGQSVPRFAANLRFRAKDCGEGYEVVEDLCQDLVNALHEADGILGSSGAELTRVPRTRLSPILARRLFFLPNTRLVSYNGRKYVAKGPIYASRVEADFLELKNLLSLPRGHPNIIQAPETLVTLTETDTRVCGFLTPFHRNGNADVYAQRLRAGRATLPCAMLLRWFRQLVSAVAFLEGHGTWHGDIKPDNLLVSDDEDIILIDFARIFTTFATSSPEVREHCARHLPSAGGSGEETCGCSNSTGIPANWPVEKIILSEVYSIGRTMYLICEGVSMVDLYRRYGWINHEYDFPTAFGPESLTPELIRPIILRCVSVEPSERITLAELASLLE